MADWNAVGERLHADVKAAGFAPEEAWQVLRIVDGLAQAQLYPGAAAAAERFWRELSARQGGEFTPGAAALAAMAAVKYARAEAKKHRKARGVGRGAEMEKA